MCVTASASGEATPQRAAIDCPSGYVFIYPEIDFGGHPWLPRAVDGSVTVLPSAIRDRGSSIRNTSDRTARTRERGADTRFRPQTRTPVNGLSGCPGSPERARAPGRPGSRLADRVPATSDAACRQGTRYR
ncbi:peptidase inhibitor family I36 protein [Streptomyces tibetensis]|uniref:peptidase inhibitor family I36 protein n=1 Tax=Streptomyces tibetensis TaxID=2382123 RepID=UPI0033C37276